MDTDHVGVGSSRGYHVDSRDALDLGSARPKQGAWRHIEHVPIDLSSLSTTAGLKLQNSPIVLRMWSTTHVELFYTNQLTDPARHT